MDKITQLPSLIMLGTAGLIVCILSHELMSTVAVSWIAETKMNSDRDR